MSGTHIHSGPLKIVLDVPIPIEDSSPKDVVSLTDDEDLQVISVKGPERLTRSQEDLVDLTSELTTSRKPSTMPTVQQIFPAQDKKGTIRCSICLDIMSHPVSTVCGHLFCEACIILAIRQMGFCPTCRKKLTRKQFHRIYL